MPDIRNSRVPDIVSALKAMNASVVIHDPHAASTEVAQEYGLTLSSRDQFHTLDGLILAVPHSEYLRDAVALHSMLKPGGVLIDVKSVLDPATVPPGQGYWSL